jgi:hypothetical protein
MCLKTLCLFALVGAVAAAQPITILNDTFADGERVTQNLPSSLAWYTTTAARTNIAVRNGGLVLVANDNDRPVWGYFPATALNVGDSLALTIDLNFSRTQTNIAAPFRLLLCSSNGLTPRRSDGGAPNGRYQGYGSFTNAGDASAGTRLRKRSGPAAANATATLFEVTDGGTDVVWDTFGAARPGLSGILQGGTPYTIVLRVTRTGADTARVAATISGGGLPANNTLAEIDAANIFTTFDTIGIGPTESSQSGDVRVTRVELVHEVNSARLINLSVRTTIPTSGDSFTLGYVVGGGSGTKPLVIRAAGPSLSAFGISDALADPKLELFASSASSGENDNWGGGAALTEAMAAVGAFAFAGPTSRDSAVLANLHSIRSSFARSHLTDLRFLSHCARASVDALPPRAQRTLGDGLRHCVLGDADVGGAAGCAGDEARPAVEEHRARARHRPRPRHAAGGQAARAAAAFSHDGIFGSRGAAPRSQLWRSAVADRS